MQIAVVLSLKNGMELFVYRELKTFAEQGGKLTLFPTKRRTGLYNPKADWQVARWNPISVLLSQPFFALRQPKKYFSLLKTALQYKAFVDFMIAWYFSQQMRDADVIYSVFGDHKFFIGYFCKEILDKPLAVIIHAYELYKNPNPALFVHALDFCDQIITVTQYNKELLQSKFGVSEQKIEVVRIGVDLETYTPQDKFIVLIAAYFSEKKGHEILFKALKEIPVDDLEVWVVGDKRGEGETDVDVRQLATELGVEDKVAFFGNLGGNALRGVFQACDVFCLPSRHDRYGEAEGFPTVLAEAMAFGKPIVSTRHVEIPRILDEVLVEENDVSGLAAAIYSVYQSKELRERLGESNRHLAEKFFSIGNSEKSYQLLENLSKK